MVKVSWNKNWPMCPVEKNWSLADWKSTISKCPGIKTGCPVEIKLERNPGWESNESKDSWFFIPDYLLYNILEEAKMQGNTVCLPKW